MNTVNTFGLDPKTIAAIKSVFLKYPVIESVIIYGSRAKGSYREGSDIDLVINSKHLTTSDLLKIENELEDLFLPYKIDLSLLHQIECRDFIKQIEKSGEVFYQR